MKKTPMTETRAYEALRLAQLHETEGRLASSAKSTADDARKLFNRGEYQYAAQRALDSLDYSVGLFHADRATVLDIVRGRP
jgi:uncharacterized protein (UPF0332 family)